ncbi:hypothetical protein DOY81_002698, partial [Sarcophaga bullata]
MLTVSRNLGITPEAWNLLLELAKVRRV